MNVERLELVYSLAFPTYLGALFALVPAAMFWNLASASQTVAWVVATWVTYSLRFVVAWGFWHQRNLLSLTGWARMHVGLGLVTGFAFGSASFVFVGLGGMAHHTALGAALMGVGIGYVGSYFYLPASPVAFVLALMTPFTALSLSSSEPLVQMLAWGCVTYVLVMLLITRRLGHLSRQLLETSERLKHEVERRRLAEAELRRGRDDLQRQVERRTEELLRAKQLSHLGTLVSGIAHELNTPLSTVLGFAEEIHRDAHPSSGLREPARWVLHEARRAADIVRDLLDFSRRSGERSHAVDLDACLGRLVKMNELRFVQDGIALSFEPGAPEAPVVGSQAKLQQVFVNLVNNAYDAILRSDDRTRAGDRGKTPKQSLHISSRVVEDDVVITFDNSGPTIDEAHLARLFDPFFTTKAPGEGTGLGLSICHGIIREHDGEVHAENLAGGGVRFSVRLPLRSTAPAAHASHDAMERSGHGARVLVVEDDARFRAWVRRTLEAADYRVTEASDGVAARRVLSETSIDVVVADNRMQRMTGLALADWIAEHRPGLRRRFVLLTGVADAETREACRKRGIRCLAKPVGREQLIEVLSKVHRDAADAIQAAPAAAAEAV